ncbi:MAG: SDR family oxidoreductase [Trueperaceae bacterium]|nr:SDR family oxidoreductase [Trueperaceae bacterium]
MDNTPIDQLSDTMNNLADQVSPDRVAIITGAGGSLASAVIPTFAQQEWRLGLLTHGSDDAERLQQSYAGALALDVDLTDYDQTVQAVKQIETRFGKVDALINLVGGFGMAPATEETLSGLNKQLHLNLITVFNATRAVLPGMLERGDGFILGTSAGAALNGGAKMGAYAAAKGALTAYLKSVHAEVASQGVDVTVLYPMGTLDTPPNRDAMPGTDPETWISPTELAASILHAATRGPRGRIPELMVYPPA